MGATTAVPLVTPDAHWSPASALLEVPCLPSHPNARGPCQARAVRNPRCTRPAWAPCSIALRSPDRLGPSGAAPVGTRTQPARRPPTNEGRVRGALPHLGRASRPGPHTGSLAALASRATCSTAPALVFGAGSGHPREQGEGLLGSWEQAEHCV